MSSCPKTTTYRAVQLSALASLFPFGCLAPVTLALMFCTGPCPFLPQGHWICCVLCWEHFLQRFRTQIKFHLLKRPSLAIMVEFSISFSSSLSLDASFSLFSQSILYIWTLPLLPLGFHLFSHLFSYSTDLAKHTITLAYCLWFLLK